MLDTGLIGVVTVTYNSASVIREFMESLLNQTYRGFLLYIVDNGSSDNTLAVVAEYSDPRLRTMSNSSNPGVAEGNNVGIRAALNDGCSSVLLVNNDTAFGPDLISTLNDGLETYHCNMVVPKVLYFEPADKIWSAGGVFSRFRGRSRHLGFNRKDNGQFDQPRRVDYAPTCCMLIERTVFERVGMMDARYFLYFDDADFCLRARRTGVRLVYLPAARLFHKVSSLIGHRSDISVRYLTRNHVYFVLKQYHFLANLYYLPICQAHVVVRCLLAQNKLRAFVIAQRAFWEGISVYRHSRKSTSSLHTASASFEIAPQKVQPGSNAA